jgi:geranylgeranyl pyrophosphate synthase
VQDIVTETGAYEQAQDDAKRYAEAAVEAARVWSNPFQSMLVDIVHFAIERSV